VPSNASVRAERERLEKLVAQQSRAIRAAFREFVQGVNSKRVLDEVSALLEHKDVSGALEIVDQYVVRFSNVIPRAMMDVGAAEAQALGLQLFKLPGAVAVGFDPTYPRAAELIRQSKLDLITRFSTQQRDAVRQALDRAFMSGEGPIATARAFRGAIGLTPHMEAAVFNYRTMLETGSREALNRNLRDRRFDSTVSRAADEGGTLTNAQIDRMVARYRERALQLRAETIARTEGTRAASLARKEATEQMTTDTGVESSRVSRVWYPTMDARTRDAHAAMEGQRVGMDEPFTDGDGNRLMYPGDPSAPAATTVGCRCIVAIEISAPR